MSVEGFGIVVAVYTPRPRCVVYFNASAAKAITEPDEFVGDVARLTGPDVDVDVDAVT